MLACTVRARATRDIDLLAQQSDLNTALGRLKELTETDMGDFVTFEFAGSRPMRVEDEYRDGLSVQFTFPSSGSNACNAFQSISSLMRSPRGSGAHCSR